MAIRVTESAGRALKELAEEGFIDAALRVSLEEGCCGPYLQLALDEPKATDVAFELEGITYLMDRGLSKLSGEVLVDFVDDGCQEGFLLSSSKPIIVLEDDCCACESECGC